jgi:predicted alpha-1,2-mannosidase
MTEVSSDEVSPAAPTKGSDFHRLELVPYAQFSDNKEPELRRSLWWKRFGAITRSLLIITILMFGLLFSRPTFSSESLTQYVNCMIGTGGHGHTFLGASVPFGAVQLSPSGFSKGWDWSSGYHYSDSTIMGFPHTHLSGTGIGDYGDILVMPYYGALRLKAGSSQDSGSGYCSHFSHSTERSRPGYYSVLLSDANISVELTATAHAGFHRYTFTRDGPCRVIIDLAQGNNDFSKACLMIRLGDGSVVRFRNSGGWSTNQTVYFAFQTSPHIPDLQIFREDELGDLTAWMVRGVLTFDRPQGPFRLKLGISSVSYQNALDNLLAEIPGWDFDAICDQADREWNDFLNRVKVETTNATDKVKFYSALYHTGIHPSLLSDVNGEYLGNDHVVYKTAGEYYTVLSLWDTYRAAHPLYTLLYPRKSGYFVDTMLRLCHQTTLMPIWQLWTAETETMSGVSSIQVVAEAFLKDVGGFAADTAFKSLTKESNRSRRGMTYHRDFEHVPYGLQAESVANGLEFGVSEASIALMAKRLGKQFEWEYYRNRSFNYKLYYDKEVGFFRARSISGSWYEPFDPFKSTSPFSNPYGEGTAWIYLWYVPHDVHGLIELLGGEKKALARLREFFTQENPYGTEFTINDLTGIIGLYAHGNEPSHHII